MIDPLVVEFTIHATPNHAFDVWTTRSDLWWPPGHTIGGAAGTTVIFEGLVGGRIYERDSHGQEHEWGSVTLWEPPERVAYRWHLFFDPSQATDVEVSFLPDGEATAVRIVQTGWERLGDQAGPRRARTSAAWSVIIDEFTAAAGK
jgi:hypothetical protein